ncbi:MAG: alanine dehydrogenase [Chitinophagaceae bacterium]
MIKIGLIKEEKIPVDNRVALTPEQCKWVMQQFANVLIVAQQSDVRCFSDDEYRRAGISVVDDLSDCQILLGIKEVPVKNLIADKTYLFFSHTKKKQAYNQPLMQALLEKNITLIDYECLEHEDGQRIIGFGFFAGIVGAHNGMMAYGKRTGSFDLGRVYKNHSFKDLIHTYFGLKIPNIKIAVTGSGRVAHGIIEIMNLMGVIEVEKEEFLAREFSYPVYVQLKGPDLYHHKENRTYIRDHFHLHPEEYECLFKNYLSQTDVLMNGVYWDVKIPRLFDMKEVQRDDFRIQVVADVTDDAQGSVPINLGDQSIEYPIYGVDKQTFQKTAPGLSTSVDVMAVGNLPNELPRDASQYFGEQLIRLILPDLLTNSSDIIERATIVKKGKLTHHFDYLHDYAYGTINTNNSLAVNE